MLFGVEVYMLLPIFSLKYRLKGSLSFAYFRQGEEAVNPERFS